MARLCRYVSDAAEKEWRRYWISAGEEGSRIEGQDEKGKWLIFEKMHAGKKPYLMGNPTAQWKGVFPPIMCALFWLKTALCCLLRFHG